VLTTVPSTDKTASLTRKTAEQKSH
jgi:hypothetical protein